MAKKPAKQEEARDDKGRWPKGTSGNPNGRPRLADALAEQIRGLEKGHLVKAINLMWDKAARGDIHAFEFLVEHGWGKMPLELGGTDGGPLEITVRHVKG